MQVMSFHEFQSRLTVTQGSSVIRGTEGHLHFNKDSSVDGKEEYTNTVRRKSHEVLRQD